MINMILRGWSPPFYFAQCDDYISEVSCDRSDVIILYLFKMINMIRSVVDRPPPSYCAKAAQWWSSISGEAYITPQLWHVSLRFDDVVAFWSYNVFFLFFPWVHQLMCCGDDQLPLWRHTSPLNCDDRCDNGWLLVQSYQAIWWCLDVLILGCSDVMWWWCVDDQTPPRKHKSHVSCDRSKQLLSSFFSLDLKHFHFHSILKRF